MRWVILVFLAMALAGCYVNRAVVDPWGYAPETPCGYWCPDRKAAALAACYEPDCPELPCGPVPLCLSEILDITLVNNPETRISWAKARQAAANYALSQSAFFPYLTAEFYHTHSRTAYLASQVEQPGNVDTESLIVNNQAQWGPQAHLTWTLLDFGQRRYTSEAARYLLYFSDYMYNQEMQTVIERVTLDYYSYLAEKKLLEADEADLANAEETLAAAELGLKQGTKNISDVLQARTQVLSAEIRLSQQHKALHTAYDTLLNDMGLPATASIELQKLPFIDPQAVNLEPLNCFIETAMQCRPDFLASLANVRSAEMHLKAAKRQWVPVLDYSLDVGRTYFSGGFNDKYDYTSTFSVSMPLFTGFHIRNTINSSKAKLEEAAAKLKQTEIQVIQQVSTAHYNVSVAFITLKAANRFLVAAKEQYDVALAQYRSGVNTILDLVSAQTSLFDARARQAKAIQQWFSSLATLTYATGLMSSKPGDCP